jgi:hypothetical protein
VPPGTEGTVAPLSGYDGPRTTPPRASARGVDPYQTTPTPVSSCSRGGSLSLSRPRRRRRRNVVVVISSCARRSPQLRVFPDAGAVSRRLAGWDTCVTRTRGHSSFLTGYDGPTTTPPRASARGVDPYPGLDDDDDDAMSSSSPAPVLEEARNCGSSQTQELFHDGSRCGSLRDDTTPVSSCSRGETPSVPPGTRGPAAPSAVTTGPRTTPPRASSRGVDAYRIRTPFRSHVIKAQA